MANGVGMRVVSNQMNMRARKKCRLFLSALFEGMRVSVSKGAGMYIDIIVNSVHAFLHTGGEHLQR